MNILKNKQNRSGVISLILLLLSFVIKLINAFAFAFGGYSVILVLSESLSRILAFVFAVIGIVKALKNKRGWILCVPGIVFPLISFCFFLVALNKSQPAYTDKYVYDREKNKMEYCLGDGFFDYSRKDIYSGEGFKGADGNFFYDVYMGGTSENDKFPYCDWIALENGAHMIGLNYFCKFYDITLEEDKIKRQTTMRQLNDSLILPWGKFEAYYEKSGETISLKYPIVHIKTGDCHISEDGMDTFVDTDLLYYAGFLFLYDERNCKEYFDYLDKKFHEIRQNGEFIEGEYFYKGNKISGPAMYISDNELLEDSAIKIGIHKDDVLSIFGLPCKTTSKNMLAYHADYFWFDFTYDENNIITRIHMCYDN